MKQLIGTGVALVTPFKNDFSIDEEALTRIVNFCIDRGVDYLVSDCQCRSIATSSGYRRK